MRDSSNWMLNRKVFSQINRLWGPIQIDLFADRLNAQVGRYMSWRPDPGALGTDASQITWDNQVCYAFHPFCLITRCLAKVLKESAEIVIVTPAWQTQPYYPMLLNMSVSSPILLPPMPNLLLCPEGNTHPLMKTQTLKLVVWKVSGDKKEAAGVSKQTSELLAAGWRQGTQRAYNSCWRQWRSWCNTRQVDPFHTSVEHIADFLSELYAKVYEYRTINNYRSSISAFHQEIEGKKVGKHDIICRLMTGIFVSPAKLSGT